MSSTLLERTLPSQNTYLHIHARITSVIVLGLKSITQMLHAFSGQGNVNSLPRTKHDDLGNIAALAELVGQLVAQLFFALLNKLHFPLDSSALQGLGHTLAGVHIVIQS